jgi:ADP-ribosylglycohydrolase
MPRHLPPNHEDRVSRVQLALDGLSVGDALGERFFYPPNFNLLDTRSAPLGPWRWTDDTAMAISIAEMLARNGGIDQDKLAASFARRFMAEPDRGYGRGAFGLLNDIDRGVPWDEAAQAMFGGLGSMGNGAAMRAAPLGAYFAEHLDDVADHAAAASQVTHMHPEGIAGGVAVAVAAGWACRQLIGLENGQGFFETVLGYLRDGSTRQGIEEASKLGDATTLEAADCLGNGSQVMAPDTVPFCLWCAWRFRESYEQAVWEAISVAGDIDTNAAIVGGIVALFVGADGIPVEWLHRREPLPIG